MTARSIWWYQKYCTFKNIVDILERPQFVTKILVFKLLLILDHKSVIPGSLCFIPRFHFVKRHYSNREKKRYEISTSRESLLLEVRVEKFASTPILDMLFHHQNEFSLVCKWKLSSCLRWMSWWIFARVFSYEEERIWNENLYWIRPPKCHRKPEKAKIPKIIRNKKPKRFFPRVRGHPSGNRVAAPHRSGC